MSSGLVYLRNRYYNPAVGRFITEDPIMDGLNWYIYCNNNPVNFWDPFGLAVTAWDKAYLNDSELERLQYITDNYDSASATQQNDWHNEAEGMRNQYRKPHEYGSSDGNTWGPNGKYSQNGYIANGSIYASTKTAVVEFSLSFGTGLDAKIMLAGVGVEIGGKRYYDLTNVFSDSPTESMEFSATAQATNKIQVGGQITGTIDPVTKEHLSNEGFIGIKIGNTTMGFDNLPKNKDFMFDFSLGGYVGIGGEAGFSINMSELIRRIFD